MDEAQFISEVYSQIYRWRLFHTQKESLELSFEASRCLVEFVHNDNDYAAKWLVLILDNVYLFWDMGNEEYQAVSEIRRLFNEQLRKK